MSLGSLLLLLSLMAGLVISTVPVHPVGATCDMDYKVVASPSSETIPRGSNFGYTISAAGPKCLTGVKVSLSASISPSVTNGPSFSVTQHSIEINFANNPINLVGSTTLSTPTGPYTFTVRVQGIQAPINGVVETTTATLTVT